MVQRLINDIADKGYARSTVEKVHLAIKSSLDQAIKNEMLIKNPAVGVILPTGERQEKAVLTVDDQAKYVEAAIDYRHGEVFIFILATGLRIGEVLALTWADIDYVNKTASITKNQIHVKDPDDPNDKWRYEIGSPKTKASCRVIPLLSVALDLLQRVQQKQQKEKDLAGENYNDQNLVFCCNQGQRLAPTNLRWDNINIRKRAGIESKVSIHGLRHTFATRGLENGIPLKVMQELLGHGSLSMTADLYTHVLPETKHGEVMKLAGTISLDGISQFSQLP